MTTSDDQRSGRKAYKVGYGRPPVETRFKPGDIGNPKGRPKRTKTVSSLIESEMTRRIKLTIDGRSKVMTLQEVIIRNLGNEAARGNLKALNLLFALRDRYRDSPDTALDPATLPADDRAIIDQFLADAQATAAAERPVGSTTEEIGRKDETDAGTTETGSQ